MTNYQTIAPTRWYMLLFISMNIVDAAKELKKEAQEEITELNDLSDLESLETEFLGKRGKLAELTKEIPELKPEERPEAGKALNKVKSGLEHILAEKKAELAKGLESAEDIWIDVTLPGEKPEQGSLHPITQTIYEIEDIFHRLGFVRRRYR
jgi:phenylalanyl-tRNA synthetase alpha chain